MNEDLGKSPFRFSFFVVLATASCCRIDAASTARATTLSTPALDWWQQCTVTQGFNQEICNGMMEVTRIDAKCKAGNNGYRQEGFLKRSHFGMNIVSIIRIGCRNCAIHVVGTKVDTFDE